ncbi:TPA: hypothetical protein SLV80_001203 [Pseudomonas aeruginosa]|nr:hypothetical protein [Pseudomonas aeruginosa]
MSNCPHESWDFGALQCSDCGAVKDHVTDAEYAKLAAEAQALREEVARGNRITLAMALDIAAVGVALGIPGEQQEGGTGEFIEAIQNLQKELEALRARVVVVPERKLLNAGVPGLNRNSGWNACLDELARLNGKTVSEGMLRGMTAFAQEIISGAMEGGSFDGADIQESAERHGLIAKQMMREPCRGPEEYCACAWSTSFPTECYRITAELRALLNQDKENGNG